MIQPFWITTTQQPRLDLGLLVIPAWILPLLFTSAFLWLKFHLRHRKMCCSKARRYLPHLLFTLRVMSLYLVVATTTNKLIGEREGRNDIIFLEFLALVLDFAFIQQADSQACVVMAWAGLVLMDISPTDAQTYTEARVVIGQVVPLLVVGSVRIERRNAGLVLSGGSLLTLMLGYTTAQDKIFPIVSRILLAGIVCVLGRCTLSLVLKPLIGRLPESWRDKWKGIFNMTIRAIAMLETGAAGSYVTAYLWSCLGWRLFMHTAGLSRSPTLSIFSLIGGGSLYSLALIVLMHLRIRRDRWRAGREHTLQTSARSWFDLSMNAAGWTTTLYGFAYLLLYFGTTS